MKSIVPLQAATDARLAVAVFLPLQEMLPAERERCYSFMAFHQNAAKL